MIEFAKRLAQLFYDYTIDDQRNLHERRLVSGGILLAFSAVLAMALCYFVYLVAMIPFSPIALGILLVVAVFLGVAYFIGVGIAL